MEFLTPKYLIVYLFLGSIIYIHFRGQIRFRAMRQLSDHSILLAPYNVFVYLFSGVPNKPILDTASMPQLKLLRDNWQVFREEALVLYEGGQIKVSEKNNDLAFNSFYKKGWKSFYFKWYGDFFPSAKELCPKTVEILKQVPGVNAAMLTLLGPGAELKRHRDPFAGSLRYHLGLSTPNADECRIFIDGNRYSWRDGEDLLFDETYIHSAINETDRDRIILFCDIERPLRFKWAQLVNKVFATIMGSATATNNFKGERVGILNRIYNYVFYIRIAGMWLKKQNKPLYYAFKYVLALYILYLIFL